MCGTAYVQLGAVPCLAVWAAVPVGALATAILVVNNLRDRATDARAGKRTLAVRFGRAGAIVEYALLLAAAYAVPVATRGRPARRGRCCRSRPLPLALARLRALVARGERPRVQRAASPRPAQLLLAHGVLFARRPRAVMRIVARRGAARALADRAARRRARAAGASARR